MVQTESDRTLTARLEADDAMAAQTFVDCRVVDTNRAKSVPQLRVSVQNAINTIMGRIERAADSVELVHDGAVAEYAKVKVGAQSAKEILEEAKAELDKHKVAVLPHLAGVKERVKAMRSDLASADNCEALLLLKSNAQEEVTQLFKHEHFKAWNFTCSTFKRNVTVAVKADAAPAQAAADRSAAEPPRFFITVGTAFRNLGVTTAKSLFEAKAGIRAAEFDLSPNLKVGTKQNVALVETTLCKKIVKSLEKNLKTSEHVMDKLDGASGKKLDKFLNTVLPDKALLQQFAVNAESSWSADFLRKRFFAMKAPFFHIGYAPYGTSEVRIVLEGNLVYGGIKAEAVPGDTLKEKRASLFAATLPEMEAMIKNSGWVVEVSAGNGILVPTGCITMMLCPSTSTVGLCWPHYSDLADKLRAMQQLGQLVDEYPECRVPQTGYQQLLEYFRAS